MSTARMKVVKLGLLLVASRWRYHYIQINISVQVRALMKPEQFGANWTMCSEVKKNSRNSRWRYDPGLILTYGVVQAWTLIM